jgi:hypothetical protein
MESRWPLVPLNSVTDELFVGLPVSRHQAKEPGQESLREPILSVGDIHEGRLVPFEGLSQTPLRPGSYERFRTRVDDVLVSCRGSQVKVARVPSEAASLLVSSNLMVVRPGGRILPGFLLTVLKCRVWQERLRLRSRSSSGMVQLTARDLAELSIPLPPLSMQTELVALVEAEEEHYWRALQAARLRRELVESLVLEALL